jgi:hypothetical protein
MLSSGVAGVKIRRCLFLALRDHLGWIWFSRNAARAELRSLNIVFR